MLNLKSQTFSNLIWNFAEQFLSKGIVIITTLVLAWFLVPNDYALIAMLAVFISLSSALVDAGFGVALIRKLDVSDIELNTVFFINIVLAVVVYLTVFFLAPLIATFYSEPRLIDLIRVVSISVFFQSLTIVPKVILTRELNFKLQLKVVLPASFLSSLIAILLAYYGYGVWALIFQILANSFFLFVFYWLLRLWKPSFSFSFGVLKELWHFARYIVVDSAVAIPFQNMYFIALAKFFTPDLVGLYFFAGKVKDMLVGLVVSSVQTVTYPVLAKIQEDQSRLKQGFRQIISATTFLVFPMMFFLAALAPVLFEVFLPEKWHGAAVYLQLMCLAALLYPLHAINLNILKVKGRSDLVLYVGMVKKIITIGIFIFTLQYGIIEIIIGQIVASVINYLPNAYYSSTLINYSIKEQLIDFLPTLIISGLVAVLIYYLQIWLSWEPVVELVVFGSLGSILYFIGAYLLRLHAYNLVYELLHEKFKRKIGH